MDEAHWMRPTAGKLEALQGYESNEKSIERIFVPHTGAPCRRRSRPSAGRVLRFSGERSAGMSEPLGILNLAIGLSGLMLCLLGILQVLAGTRADKRTVRYFLLSYSTLFLFAGANLAG